MQRKAWVLCLAVAILGACDRRREIPEASSQAACSPVTLGPAEELAKRTDLPVDQVVTIEGMLHPSFQPWQQDNVKRSLGKLMGTERRILLFQEYRDEPPTLSTKMTGLLRRYRDLPDNPFAAVKTQVKERLGWEIPEDAYVLMEGFRPEGCQ